ncbi:MAG: PAS domain S-box protein [Gammaproteobacteria bacterium]
MRNQELRRRVLEQQVEILDLAHVLIRDTEDHIQFWNTGAEGLYGWTKEEALGQISHALLQTQFPEPLASIKARLWQEGQWKGELMHRTRDGHQIAVASHWVLHNDAQGIPVLILEVNNDITELKRSERVVQELNIALANAMPGISRCDARGRYIEINEHYAQMLGYDPGELMGADWRPVIHPEDQQLALSAYERLRGEGQAEFEARAVRKDGSAFHLQALLVAITDSRDKFVGHYCFIRDISERKREQELRESRERLRAFAIHLDSAIEAERMRMSREIHDELGQALTSLMIDLGWTDAHLRHGSAHQDSGALRGKIQSMSETVESMITNIRQLATELRPPLLDKVGLGAAIETHARQLQERTGIRCEVSLEGDITLEQDRSLSVFRVYQEAMTNVARHARASRVEIRLSCEEDALLLEVSDNGRVAVPEAADPASLGIIGMQERARILGGSLDIHGDPGVGTTVRLDVPIVRSVRTRDAKGTKILIVDDHPVVRHGVKQILMEAPLNATVDEARDAASMREHVCTKDCDLVLLDLSLPDKSGLECLSELKRIRPKLPVLVLSMYSDTQFAVPALTAGASGYLTKERAPKELVSAVRKVLAGGKYMSEQLAKQLAFDVIDGAGKLPHELLSQREFRVMRLIASGKTVSEIAHEAHLSPKTISTYRSRVLRKMNLNTNADLTQYCTRHGLIQ